MNNKIQILIVEDDSTLSRIIGDFLQQKFSCKVQICASVSETIEVLKQHKFDAMLLDLNLPDAKGSKTLEKLNIYIEFPVVIFTAINDPVIIRHVKQYGYAIIAKPNIKSAIQIIDMAIKYRIDKLHERSAYSRIDTRNMEADTINGTVN